MADSNEPKKETVPIVVSTQQSSAPAPAPTRSPPAQIPMLLCWALLAAATAILILQIWNYLS